MTTLATCREGTYMHVHTRLPILYMYFNYKPEFNMSTDKHACTVDLRNSTHAVKKRH